MITAAKQCQGPLWWQLWPNFGLCPANPVNYCHYPHSLQGQEYTTATGQQAFCQPMAQIFSWSCKK